MTIVVYGPPACGKTRNSGRIASHFGISVIVDDWSPRQHVLTPGAIHFTHEHPGAIVADCHAFAELRLPQTEVPFTRVSPRYKGDYRR